MSHISPLNNRRLASPQADVEICNYAKDLPDRRRTTHKKKNFLFGNKKKSKLYREYNLE